MSNEIRQKLSEIYRSSTRIEALSKIDNDEDRSRARTIAETAMRLRYKARGQYERNRPEMVERYAEQIRKVNRQALSGPALTPPGVVRRPMSDGEIYQKAADIAWDRHERRITRINLAEQRMTERLGRSAERHRDRKR